MPRRRHQVLREDAQDDGDKKARSPGRARRKPLKPFACGDAGLTGELVVTTLVCFLLCTRGCGCIGARHSPRPLTFRGGAFMQTPGASRRENAKVCLCVSPSLRGALATKQSILSLCCSHGLLRFARNDC